jgi:hypothetical protein
VFAVFVVEPDFFSFPVPAEIRKVCGQLNFWRQERFINVCVGDIVGNSQFSGTSYDMLRNSTAYLKVVAIVVVAAVAGGIYFATTQNTVIAICI